LVIPVGLFPSYPIGTASWIVWLQPFNVTISLHFLYLLSVFLKLYVPAEESKVKLCEWSSSCVKRIIYSIYILELLVTLLQARIVVAELLGVGLIR
jgi:hypothetical protein